MKAYFIDSQLSSNIFDDSTKINISQIIIASDREKAKYLFFKDKKSHISWNDIHAKILMKDIISKECTIHKDHILHGLLWSIVDEKGFNNGKK